MKQPDFHSNVILQNLFLLENIQGGIVYSDYEPPFHLRYATEGMTHLSGYSREELLSMQQMDLVYDEDVAPLTEDVGRQLAEGDTFEVEYRLKRKDGSHVHILDRAKVVAHENGKKYIHCLLTDITELKNMEQSLRLSEEKHKIAMQKSGNAILEYTPDGMLKISENYPQIFGCEAPSGTLEELAHSGWVGVAHVEPLVSLFEDALQEKKNVYMELQLQVKDGRFVWCSLHLTPLSTPFGMVYAIVGCLQNIDARRRHLETLTKLSERDGLTNAYNRATMESIIDKHLTAGINPACGALIILDVDYFKNVNDSLGHDVGDDLLIRLVSEIRSCLQAGNLLGRLGGDEFLIFVPHPTNVDSIAFEAQHIVEYVDNAFKNSRYPITVSLGVAICGPGCTTFKELYKNADLALYETKRGGRNGFTIFSEICAERR